MKYVNVLCRRSKFGHVQLYSGGGYLVPLGSSYNDTTQRVQNAFSEDWVDRYTRAVFVEFSLYSMAEDLTTSVSILFEFPLSGRYFNTRQVGVLSVQHGRRPHHFGVHSL